ncbi:hypothetical protein [Hankyongella ginsenosidimutans]|uniref:hypothetical protein n=1 Tax=Hankyongella ginsenosidimutans TaxID=1763828 RepID=UPI001FE8A76C|nr:hypothetical protein [Hankyongella ginsenosidimutans]
MLGVAFTTVALPENGTRADYQRAYLEDMPQGPSVTRSLCRTVPISAGLRAQMP